MCNAQSRHSHNRRVTLTTHHPTQSNHHSSDLTSIPSRYFLTSTISIPLSSLTLPLLSHATPRPCANVSLYLTITLGSLSICLFSSSRSHTSRLNLVSKCSSSKSASSP